MRNNKNNKGFSLVELIVVVLIMAIIAVALAPQVMKWVNNSRISTDMQTTDALVSAYTLALTNESAYAKIPSTSKTAEFKSGNLSITSDSTFDTAISSKAKDYFGSDTISLKNTGYSIKITIDPSGKVTGALNDGSNDVTGLDD